MAYQALARKWRPKKFSDLVGQEHVVGALQNAIQQGRLHHAYLLTGTRGVGKTTIARILAKSLNCEQGVGGEPCGVCSACTQIDAGRFVDLLEIDAASNTGIDNIREVLENAQYMPTSGRYKVYIIDEVHMLSKSAFNAMLKTLEEPPEHVKFILATTDPQKVPVTVLSRCLQFVLRNMTTTQISQHLAYISTRENIPFEENALTVLARAAMGSMRDALSLLDQGIALGSGRVSENDIRHMLGAVDKRYLFQLLSSIIQEDGATLMAQAAELNSRSVGFGNTLGEMASLLQELALIQIVPSALSDDEPEKELLLSFSHQLSAEQIQLYYQCVLQGKKDLPLAPDEYAGFMMTLLRMLAFAPLAAKPDQVNWQVENTDLHNPVVKEKIAATPIKSISESEPSDIVSHGQTDQLEVTKENNIAAEKNAATMLADSIKTEPEEEVFDSVPISVLVEDKISLPWEEESVSVEAESNTIPTENVTKAISSEQIEPEPPVEPDAFVELSLDQVVPEEIIQSYDTDTVDEVSAASDNALDVVEGISNPEDTHYKEASPNTNAFTLSDETGVVDDSLVVEEIPPLTLENWPKIVGVLQTKLGAAQMLLKNAVPTEIKDNFMCLAVSDHAIDTEELRSKVTKILSEVYQTNWVIRVEDLSSGQETPNMLQQKEKDRRKAQALDTLANDPVAQELLSVFNGQWLTETVELKS